MKINGSALHLVPALLLAAALCLSAGCAGYNTGKAGNGMKTQNYGNDGYLGTTNANPHITGRNMATSDANDAEAMRQAIGNLRGIAGANILFNGPDVYVALKMDSGVDARRAPTVEREAAAVLRFNFPRYTIHVYSTK